MTLDEKLELFQEQITCGKTYTPGTMTPGVSC